MSWTSTIKDGAKNFAQNVIAGAGRTTGSIVVFTAVIAVIALIVYSIPISTIISTCTICAG